MQEDKPKGIDSSPDSDNEFSDLPRDERGPPTIFNQEEEADAGNDLAQPPEEPTLEPERREIEEPPTLYTPDSMESSPWASEKPDYQTVHREEPPTAFASNEDRAMPEIPAVSKVPTFFEKNQKDQEPHPSGSFSYVKVFWVLIPFLMAGLGMGVYVAWRHVQAERISDLIEQANSSIAIDTLSGYNDAKATLQQLFQVDRENIRGKALMAMILARMNDEYGPNLSLKEEAQKIVAQEALLAANETDLLWAKYHLNPESQSIQAEVKQALSKTPEDPKLLELGGELALRQGDLRKGEDLLSKCLANDPSNIRAQYFLGGVAAQIGKPGEAEKIFAEVLTRNGMHAGTLLALSRLRVEKNKDLDQAGADLEKLVKLPHVTDRQKAQGHFYLARLAFLKEDRTRALSEVNAAKELLPEEGVFQSRLASMCREFNELDEAVSRAKKALLATPGDGSLKLLIIDSEMPVKSPKETLRDLEKLVGQKVPAGPFFLLRGEALLKAEQFSEALKDFSELPKGAAERTKARALSVLALLGRKEMEPARKEAVSLLRDAPEDAWSHYAIGQYYLAKRLGRAAAASWAKSISFDPHFYPALFQLAQLAFEQNKDQEAKDLLRRALTANPFDFESRDLSGKILMHLGETSEALDAFARLVQYKPNSASGLVGMAESLLVLGRIDQAKLAMDKAKKNGAEDAHAKHVEGQILLASRQFVPAVRALMQADSLEPNQPNILADLGFAQLGAHWYTQAEKSLRKSLYYKRLPRPQEGLADLLMLKGKHREAALAYETAGGLAKQREAQASEVGRLYLLAGKAWLKQESKDGRFFQARRLFTQASRLVPNDAEPMFQIGATWDREDSVEAARKNYEKALSIDPHHQETLFRWGALEFDKDNHKRAKELLETLLSLGPDEAYAKKAKEFLKKIK